ncbi:hypothetical protein J4456_01780 [Candidatus Pacearchaeota archaeon]|nr:hypothetical protein [Candidatus Pacearchaeota archaeon]
MKKESYVLIFILIVISLFFISYFKIQGLAIDEFGEEYEVVENKKPYLGKLCFELWVCKNIGPCVNNAQKKSCYDLNHCGSEKLKPVDKVYCEKNTDYSSYFILGGILIAIFIFILIVVFNKHKVY